MKKETRKQVDYNKVVNIAEDGEITVLSYVFNDGNGFKGATGNIFYPVSEERYEEAVGDENVIQYLIDSGMELTTDDQKRTGFAGMVKQMGLTEKESLMFDTSYNELWDYLRKACGLDKKSAYIFECVGGGRCFDEKFNGNINIELSEIIRKYENK